MRSRRPGPRINEIRLADERRLAQDARDRFGSELKALALARGPWVVAVSGGLDSVALLQLIAEQGPALRVTPVVAHVDHGIHPDSRAVAELVRRHATRLGLEFVSEALALGPAVSETVARRGRYDALRAMAAWAHACGIHQRGGMSGKAAGIPRRVLGVGAQQRNSILKLNKCNNK